MLIRRQKTNRFQLEPKVQVTERDARLAAGSVTHFPKTGRCHSEGRRLWELDRRPFTLNTIHPSWGKPGSQNYSPPTL